MARKLTPKQIAKAEDALISESYTRLAAGRSINVFRIKDVFAAGRNALALHLDLDQAIENAIELHCEPT